MPTLVCWLAAHGLGDAVTVVEMMAEIVTDPDMGPEERTT